jgi:hypothetical protein
MNQACDTLFYQGMNSSQTQALKYTGAAKITASTGEIMWCEGKNNLLPIHVITNLHVGDEIADVNLQPFATYMAMLNPVNLLGVVLTGLSNWLNGFHFISAANYGEPSVVYHAPVVSNISIGQESDIESHRKKYQSWLRRDDRQSSLILYGVSRGTAATFCAFAKEKYPEVKLVILEGAIDSVENILPKRAAKICSSEYLAQKTLSMMKSGLSMFTSYREDGPSPLSCVDDYPENIPTVFVTSIKDAEVPCENTKNIAQALAGRGKNDVYLLTLNHSSHPNYMFDHQEDRDRYEAFIHAIYKKYDLEHDAGLAEKGALILDDALLSTPKNRILPCRN